ncbi:RsmD family RNA methyltransferase [Microvirga sp. STR05]|uniref:RsmD family RNA methyltransferase n=1 Tax=Hymenobacter duratus TaxID=2771356 RepID=A0ABR8JFN1_9BACT|nr:class I SAM-dependent methyltransferase [Hymenobacter duratus]MBD2714393.1 RsmD family RNA methyltransferase [Hymenobacter duratus]MBR7949296.1 RsmD family RNA methyltransferase [Microvirga sp. STR05]
MEFPLPAASRQYVAEHLHDDPAQLALQARRYPGLPIPDLVRQIQARQKARPKVPAWADNPDLIFPPALSVEQASSARTAAFKASLVSGQRLVDLTGGFGVDVSCFAEQVAEVHYVERNAALAEVVRFNLTHLGVRNVQYHAVDAVNFLRSTPDTFDWIYLDPARRDTAARKIFRLQDCEPDVLRLMPLLLHKGRRVLLKTSPMLDIEQAILELRQVRRLWVVAVDNECKEVLYELGPEPAVDPERYTVNLRRDGTQQEFRMNRAREARAIPRYAEPQQYLYEPNVAVLKAGGFRSIGTAFELLKLHQHSHLYTSDVLRTDFPGRIFRIRAVGKYDGVSLKAHLGSDGRAHVTTRNFPDTVAEFRHRTGIREGGETYLFATTNLEGKLMVLVCEKL